MSSARRLQALPERDVHGPVRSARHGELPGAVDRVDDPDAIGLNAGDVVDRLLGQHRVVGPGPTQAVEDQRVGPPVAGIAEVVRVVEADLLAHRQQQFTGFFGHLGGQRRIGQAHRVSITNHLAADITGSPHYAVVTMSTADQPSSDSLTSALSKAKIPSENHGFIRSVTSRHRHRRVRRSWRPVRPTSGPPDATAFRICTSTTGIRTGSPPKRKSAASPAARSAVRARGRARCTWSTRRPRSVPLARARPTSAEKPRSATAACRSR